jgi:hypothetical protein
MATKRPNREEIVVRLRLDESSMAGHLAPQNRQFLFDLEDMSARRGKVAMRTNAANSRFAPQAISSFAN